MAGVQFIYHSPTTPGNPGFSIDLTDLAAQQGVRLGSVAGFITEAELGAVGQSGLQLDDPTGTAGNSGDAIVGLKQLSVNEGRAPSGNRRIGEFYIADRRYYRGKGGQSDSLRTAAARVIDMTLSDINSFLSFRILRTGTANGSNTSFNRPAETDVERVTALLAVSFLSTTLFNGLVSSSNPVDMDAVDYQGQTPADVLNDCAQQSGKNYFVFYDEAGTYTPSAGDFGLFYDSNDSSAYPAAVAATQVSNVLTDISAGNGGPIWYPLIDAVLVRDPSRVISGAFFPNGSNSVYVENPTTSYAFGWRDAVGNTQNLKTVPMITARGNRYLLENSTEDDRITFTLKLPAAHVNDWKEGQWAQVKFSHLPGYEDFTSVRCLARTVASDEMTDEFYNTRYEVTPIVSQPSGAFDTQVNGEAFSGIPMLPRATTPGNVLIALITSSGFTASFPSEGRFLDNPPTSGSPSVPPYSPAQSAAWTLLGVAQTDYSGMNLGGPCSGFSTTPYCTSGILTAVYWRFVQPGEITTAPVAVSTDTINAGACAWLWELPTTVAPTAGDIVISTHMAGNTGTLALPSIAGNVIGLFAFHLDNPSGHPTVSMAGNSGTTAVRITDRNNYPGPYVSTYPPGGYNTPAIYIGQRPTGGVMSVDYDFVAVPNNYTSLNVCAVGIVIPDGILLPDIPYPANQSA